MRNIKNFAIFILAAAVLSSCGGLNKMVKDSDLVNYKVTPEVLEMHGGEVDLTVDVNYPAKYFNKKAVVTLTPVVRYEGGEKALDPLVGSVGGLGAGDAADDDADRPGATPSALVDLDALGRDDAVGHQATIQQVWVIARTPVRRDILVRPQALQNALGKRVDDAVDGGWVGAGRHERVIGCAGARDRCGRGPGC